MSFIISPLTSFFVSYLDVRNFLLVGAADLRHILKTCAFRNRKERKTRLNVCALHEIGVSTTVLIILPHLAKDSVSSRDILTMDLYFSHLYKK